MPINPADIPTKWQMECPDHGPLVVKGRPQAQKYKAENEMWEHRHAGHVNATVKPVV